jgi:hypothetical protein
MVSQDGIRFAILSALDWHEKKSSDGFFESKIRGDALGNEIVFERER